MSRIIKRMLEVIVLVCCVWPGWAQEKVVYKTIDTLSLSMDIFYPEQVDTKKKYPAIVFFFGGGWSNGSTSQFVTHAKYFTGRGIISVLVDYRVRSRHHTTPFQSLEDAKSAMRFLRSNAEKFQIDPDKIAASGGSAGGHLAAATATVEKYNDVNDNPAVSAKPNALILFNPVIDNGPGGYGFERIGEEYPYFSPLHNIRKGTPPTVIFLGTKDHLVPVETAQYYKKVMERVGSRCDLFLFEDQPHGFFNLRKGSEYYRKTLFLADEFLISIGYLSGQPDMKKIDFGLPEDKKTQ